MTTMLNTPDDASNWRGNGLCDAGDDLHFADVEELVEDQGFPRTEAHEFVAEAEAEAKALCDSCPVRGRCLDSAMMNDEEWGVWGGMNRAERLGFRAVWAAEKRDQGVRTMVRKDQDVLHANPGVNFRYRIRSEQAQQTIDLLMREPEDWSVNTGLYCNPTYGTHGRKQLIDMFDMIKRYPERSAKELADGFGRSANWFNTVTRAARRALGTG